MLVRVFGALAVAALPQAATAQDVRAPMAPVEEPAPPPEVVPPVRLRVIVLVASDADRALLARVRGQTSDLDVDLVEAPQAAAPASLAEQVKVADGLTRAGGARVAAWFELPPRDGRAVVYVSETTSGRVFARVLGGDAGRAAGPDTALLEEAAVVLRGALRALASGAVIGIHREELLPKPPPRPAVVARPAVPPSPDAGVFVAAGWQTALDGASARGLPAATLELGADYAGWEAAMVAGVGLPSEIEDDYATVRLSRHVAALRAGRRFVSARAFELRAGVAAGVAGFDRVTIGTSEGVRPDRARLTPSLLVSPEIAVGWHGGRRRAAPAVLAVVGADFTPGAPTLGYDVGGQFETAHEIRRIQARVGLVVRLEVR